MNRLIISKKQLLILIILICFIAKLYQFYILPEKYFYDSNFILLIIQNKVVGDKSYNFTAKFFSLFYKIFKIDNVKYCNLIVGVFFNIFIVLYLIKLLKGRQFNFIYTILMCSSIFLANIYVFNISKELIQFIIFSIIFYVAMSKLISIYKIILICLLYFLESLLFRSYFIIMIPLFVFVYLLKEKRNFKSLLKIMICTLILLFILCLMVKYFLPMQFEQLLTARSTVNDLRINSVDAQTIILDIVKNDGSLLIFITNVALSLIRLCFPLELFVKGFIYIAFLIFQCFFIYCLYAIVKSKSKSNSILISVIVAFLFVSALFEPDFGSFLRHESTLLLFCLYVFQFLRLKNNILCERVGVKAV